ncbi:MAG: N4-gp56 family major capsid protein [Pseudoalteromonas sp.]|uniref:N4-gp56 family major capsid protein n=1 Tax=Pseudoalteromonas sp. TaxID=53249 RepID=UPI001D27CEB1|nr:N4-gp56 family major capsid protein [Pseudoalteromonas sp.]NRA77137.1 N4-gp56 family major capsid protein [Pseudoalteromonas sp.]
MANERVYGTGDNSSIGTQFNTFFYQKKALVEVAKEQYFGQMADVTSMPKHFGKKIKKYHYLPMLDDANINDQGIDAAGLIAQQEVTLKVTFPNLAAPLWADSIVGSVAYFVGEGADAAAAGAAAILKFNGWCEATVLAGGLGLTLVGGTEDLKQFDAINETDGLAYVLGYRFAGLESSADSAALILAVDALAEMASGNMYGSSKDVGTISSKLPALSETGGRVNRVGFKRIELEGSISKFGFFDEYTQESLDFDTDAELEMHVNREMIFGANELTEDALQIDLLNAAGVIRFGGEAAATNQLTGANGATVSVVSYEDLMRLSIDLDNNRTPKSTSIISGSRMIDTKTVNGARYLFIGSELIPTMKKMTDLHNNPAFISVEKYASAGNIARGEIGTVDQFRIIVVPEMMHWQGAGAAEGTNDGYRATGGNYDVFPMLVVGDKSFTTIGFQTDGDTVKFKIFNKKPGLATADRNDPYGEMGFMSIKWYYGSMILRPERIALVKVVAEY